MTDTATHARITGEESSAAVFADGWLPDVDVFPELTELRQEHERIRDQYRAESANVRSVKHRIDVDKKQREKDMRDAFLAGTSVDEVAAESEALSTELEQAKERAHAALEAYIEHINICVATIVEHGPGWLEQIDSFDADAHAEREELRKKLIEADRKIGSFFQLAYWIDRTAGCERSDINSGTNLNAAEFPPAHIPYKSIPAPAPQDEDEQARESQRFMEESYAGGLAGGANRITDDESTDREDEFMTPPQLADEEVARINADIRGELGREGVL